MRGNPIDPSMDFGRGLAKAGFDLTVPFGQLGSRKFTRGEPPRFAAQKTHASVREALAAGPQSFVGLMRALGSQDGREIVIELEKLRSEGLLGRLELGEYTLKR